MKDKFGSVMAYLLSQRLFWTPIDDASGVLRFDVENAVPFANPSDYEILRNDWGYAFEPGIRHIVVWVKQRLPVDGQGALSVEGRAIVERFVEREFGERVREGGGGVVWFKNTTDLQSVRSLEHVHVLVRGVGEGVLERWMK